MNLPQPQQREPDRVRRWMREELTLVLKGAPATRTQVVWEHCLELETQWVRQERVWWEQVQEVVERIKEKSGGGYE